MAVKRARPDVPGSAAALRREARILSAASHPAIVPVLDLLDDPLEPAMVLGWADGGSLGDLLADGPLAATDLLHLLRPLAEGLEALHAAGVAHLDVTVENVLLAAAGPVLVDPAPPGAGTPGYTDPVVAAGGLPSARSDVFGLAACAHVALTGRRPRTGGGVAIGLTLPAAVAEALGAGLHPDPRQRPGSPSAFVDRLEAAVRRTGGDEVVGLGRPVRRAPERPVAPARTWPFGRWQEEAAAADRRRSALAEALAPAAPRRTARRRAAIAIVAVAVCALVLAVALGPAVRPISQHFDQIFGV